MIELLQNRSQRLQFEVSSPNGILLFREASSMLVTYGQSILEITKNNILSQEMVHTINKHINKQINKKTNMNF